MREQKKILKKEKFQITILHKNTKNVKISIKFKYFLIEIQIQIPEDSPRDKSGRI